VQYLGAILGVHPHTQGRCGHHQEHGDQSCTVFLADYRTMRLRCSGGSDWSYRSRTGSATDMQRILLVVLIGDDMLRQSADRKHQLRCGTQEEHDDA
jgi:hypothetical protein